MAVPGNRDCCPGDAINGKLIRAYKFSSSLNRTEPGLYAVM